MIISGRAQPNASVADAGVIYKTFRRLGVGSSLSDLASALDFEAYGAFLLIPRLLASFKCHSSLTDKIFIAGQSYQRWLSPNSGVLLGTRQSIPLQTVTTQVLEVQSRKRRQ